MSTACDLYRKTLLDSVTGTRIRLRKGKDTRLSYIVPMK